MPPDHFMGFPNSPRSPLSFFFSPQMAPPHPYVKPIWRRLSPRCSTEVLYKNGDFGGFGRTRHPPPA